MRVEQRQKQRRAALGHAADKDWVCVLEVLAQVGGHGDRLGSKSASRSSIFGEGRRGRGMRCGWPFGHPLHCTAAHFNDLCCLAHFASGSK